MDAKLHNETAKFQTPTASSREFMKHSSRSKLVTWSAMVALFVACSVTFEGLSPISTASAQSSLCPSGILNVVAFGADGTADGDTAAFLAAYNAATTPSSGCYNIPIFVPGRNPPGFQGKPWPGHWPVITKPVTIEGAGMASTNFSGDTTGWPVFWVQAPNVNLSSFGFWGSSAVGIKLDAGSTGAVLNNVGCRSSVETFIYAGGTSNITMNDVISENCGNSTTANPGAGGALVILSCSNITLTSFESFGAKNWSIVVMQSQNVTFNGGKTDYGFVYNMTEPEVFIDNSSVTMTNGFWLAGTNNYELSLNGNSTFVGRNIAFGGGSPFPSPTPNIFFAPYMASSFTCNNCTFANSDPTVPYTTPANFEVVSASPVIETSPTTVAAFSPPQTVISVIGQTLSMISASAPYYQIQVN
jgi:hypothetical protein